MFRSPMEKLLLLVLLAGSACGCGSNPYETAVVTGRVMCGDQPAWGGYVFFEPIDAPDQTGRPAGNPGSRSSGQVGQDGTFRLKLEAHGANAEEDGAVIGPHRVSWSPPQTEQRKWNPSDDWLDDAEKEQLKAKLAAEPIFPKLDCGLEITPGQVDVKADENVFEFTLKAGAPPPAPATLGGSS